MRIVPLPADLELAPYERRATLGPAEGMSDQDCETIEILRSIVQLPSGQELPTVAACVFVNGEELERIRAYGGRFWLEFIGVTFPPVMLRAPDVELGPRDPADTAEAIVADLATVLHHPNPQGATGDPEAGPVAIELLNHLAARARAVLRTE